MPGNLEFNTEYIKEAVSDKDFEGIFPEVKKAHSYLEDHNGPGKDFLGWVDLPDNTGEELLRDITETAGTLRDASDVIIIIGIGGSYLGGRAVVKALSSDLINEKVFFAGYNLSCDKLRSVLDNLDGKDVCVNVISKSGTTTEPAVTFRIVEDFLRKKYGSNSIKNRVVCTTDREKGALKAIAEDRGYKSFVIPENVGGRFSVLSPVGLLPAAYAGIDIRELIDGAKKQSRESRTCDLTNNLSYRYAAVRNILYRKGKKIEILSNFDNKLHFIGEWWKQLFAESEGKEGRGIFPSLCDFSTDLHSIGQLIQEGERNIFETFLIADKQDQRCAIPSDRKDLDGLNYLTGKQVDFINRKAYEATREAHFEGGVPNATIMLSEKSAFCLGRLFYFFEKAVALSGYLSGVNPFDQPGVEAYKQKMFKLLGKPGA